MIKLVLFLKKIYVLLLFIVLEFLALHYYANSTSYTKAKLLTASNGVVGGVYGFFSDVNHYFTLKRDNRLLLDEVTELRNRLAAYEGPDSALVRKTPEGELNAYLYASARVVNNSITRQENYLTLNKGLRDGVEADMAVLSPEGCMVGYVLSCSDRFAVCMSVLNRNFRTSGKIKGENYFGSIYWDGLDHQYVILTEIPKYAELSRGDTIVTTDYSSIFPPDMMIGTVEEWTLNNATFYDVKVRLAARIPALTDVLLVKYMDGAERTALEQEARSAGY
ncbi:rod shape-determining protein MreC [Gallalistipes aquisgranensis]|uniref:rod shape-determining protein MreC n=1 Tax=Gallalistipes aquisgranensis TaxID=2779358 RepID=UPI001CF853EB|nr:rod shape-determining protein MreC [Gallalistipes aquisgranensis]MBE5033902.1 rod shape-determining protein MreC [Gallalistipes aquisgranensis]